jgi:hydroxyethylthiazole kinase-like uncharacterized protein yjeF
MYQFYTVIQYFGTIMMLKVTTTEEMRQLDREAVEKYGIPEELLMENAGLAAARVIQTRFGTKKKSFLILCGAGNNGGDGLVVARKLHSLGAKVQVILLGKTENFSKVTGINFNAVKKLAIQVVVNPDKETIIEKSLLSEAIIDALFGTGLTRPIEGIYYQAIKIINESQKTVFSLDIPSGINGNTGGINGIAVKADYTVTFGLPKIGNILYPGAFYCGSLYVTHISFPPDLYHSEEIGCEINIPAPLPARKPDGHKGTFGQVLFISGASNYYGAPYLASYAFLKSGGGMAHLAAPSSIIPVIAGKAPEIVFHPQKETEEKSLAYGAKKELLELAEKMNMVVLGPGVSLASETQRLILDLIKEIDKPLLIDADGLTILSKDMEVLASRRAATILTPHLGELARLTGLDKEKLNDNRMETAGTWAGKWGALLVMKGARTIISQPDGKTAINISGNSGMATAGSGDVLTGIIAAMYGLGLDLSEAVKTGVFIHGLSGDIAAEKLGEDGITARDILINLPEAVKLLREEYDSPAGSFFNQEYTTESSGEFFSRYKISLV